MEDLDSLKKDLKTTKDLQNIVSTMKAISAVNIKKFEKVVSNLLKYQTVVNLGIQAILEENNNILKYINYIQNEFNNKLDKKNLIIVIGSNQGLCGRFNDRINKFFIDDIKNINDIFITIGDRINMITKANHINVYRHFSIPNSINLILNLVYELFNLIDDLFNKKLVKKVIVYFTSYDKKSIGILTKKNLLPLDEHYFQNLTKRQWPTNNKPLWKIETKKLLSDFIRQFIFIDIYSMIASSMTAEQKNRLTTLEGAEQNIKDHILDISLKYNQTRQNVITCELLDIISATINKNEDYF